MRQRVRTARINRIEGRMGSLIVLFVLLALGLETGYGKGKCPPGTYGSNSNGEQLVCLECPLGRYGEDFGLLDASCSGPCKGGHYGDTPGQRTSECTGLCLAGYYCPPGSTSPKEKKCSSPEHYCPKGSSEPLDVDSGYYSIGRDDSDDPETWKRMVDTGTTRSSQAICEPGHFCVKGIKEQCPAGHYGETQGLATSDCTGLCPLGHYCPSAAETPIPCPAGRFGNVTGLTTESCSGECLPGYWCDPGSSSPSENLCDPGYYGGLGESKSACSGKCKQGFYCPAGSSTATENPCGPLDRYCPKGSGNFTLVSPGHFSTLDQSSQEICPRGHYCENGVKFECPAGRYGETTGLRNSSCTGLCFPGFYCEAGSVSPYQNRCGGSNVYCPKGSSSPTPVTLGYYSAGGSVSTRSEEYVCPVGFYCDESGIKRQCPAGRYGAVPGLSSKECSGLCLEGYYCTKQSTRPDQYPCNAGRYGDVKGNRSPSCSGPCQPGYYCPEGSTSRDQHICSSGAEEPPDIPVELPYGAVAGELYGSQGSKDYAQIPKDKVYCPIESSKPLAVPQGYVAVGGSLGARTSIAQIT